MYNVGDGKWMKEGPKLRKNVGIPTVHEIHSYMFKSKVAPRFAVRKTYVPVKRDT
jgi:hypothetical protein